MNSKRKILTRQRMWTLGSMIKALCHTSKASLDYLPITISVMSWLMTFIQGRWIFKPFIKDVFHNHWKVMKNLQLKKCVYFVQKPWKFVQLLLKDVNVRLLLKENVQLIFLYVEDPGKFQTESVNTIKLPWNMDPYPKQSFLISFFSLFWCPASIKDVFITIERLWKIFNTKWFVQKPWRLLLKDINIKKKCAADIFFILKILWLLLAVFQCFLKNVRLLPKRY